MIDLSDDEKENFRNTYLTIFFLFFSVTVIGCCTNNFFARVVLHINYLEVRWCQGHHSSEKSAANEAQLPVWCIVRVSFSLFEMFSRNEHNTDVDISEYSKINWLGTRDKQPFVFCTLGLCTEVHTRTPCKVQSPHETAEHEWNTLQTLVFMMDGACGRERARFRFVSLTRNMKAFL